MADGRSNKPFYLRWESWLAISAIVISSFSLWVSYMSWQDIRRVEKVDVEPEFTISPYLPTKKIAGSVAPFCSIMNAGRVAATHFQVKTHRLIYQTDGTLTQQSVSTFPPFPRFEPFHTEQFGMLFAYLTDSDNISIQNRTTVSLILVISISYTREADARRFRKASIFLLNESKEWVRESHSSIDQSNVAGIRKEVLDYLSNEKEVFSVDLIDIP